MIRYIAAEVELSNGVITKQILSNEYFTNSITLMLPSEYEGILVKNVTNAGITDLDAIELIFNDVKYLTLINSRTQEREELTKKYIRESIIALDKNKGLIDDQYRLNHHILAAFKNTFFGFIRVNEFLVSNFESVIKSIYRSSMSTAEVSLDYFNRLTINSDNIEVYAKRRADIASDIVAWNEKQYLDTVSKQIVKEE